jgi:thiamine-monophosphate kinase
MTRISEIREDALIARLVDLVPTADAVEGPGDDCAVIDGGGDVLTLLKTDALVEGVHFLKDADPRKVGWKAVARVVSDFAAMGGLPERFLVTLALPGEMELEWIEEFYRGMGECLEKYDSVLAGGETCGVPDGSAAVISIAATGRVEREYLVTRSGARVGESIWVTGELGGSLSGKHLSFEPRVKAARWLVKHFKPSAMMDLSDGIASDLPRLAKASGCGFEIERKRLPLTSGCSVEEALNDGEDFELIFTISNEKDISTLPDAWKDEFPDLKITRIGRFVKAGEGETLGEGWDHFG